MWVWVWEEADKLSAALKKGRLGWVHAMTVRCHVTMAVDLVADGSLTLE